VLGYLQLMIFDSSHGTVLVTIGTKHGFILAADSIQTRSGKIIHDKKQKIFKVSKFIACTITGRTEVTATDKEDHYHYDLSDELIRYAGSQKGITVQHTAEQISELFYRVIAPISEQFPEFLDDWLERSSVT